VLAAAGRMHAHGRGMRTICRNVVIPGPFISRGPVVVEAFSLASVVSALQATLRKRRRRGIGAAF
ncbi:MAG: hypothetical protein LC797_07475, partial [Chloroflexi bacterium]|nr:hypothetical protein [Chloroflexota bacterium]